MTTVDDAQLVERLFRVDPAAFHNLVDLYKKRIYFLALDMVGNAADAEDVSQDVFLKVHRSLRTFKKDAKLGSWIYRIAYNTCIDHIRKKEQTPRTLGEEVLDARARVEADVLFSAPPADPSRAAEAELLQRSLAGALEKVSPQEKAVFLLRHYDDLMLREIAEVLGLSLGSVKSYLFRAIQKLRRELGGRVTAPGLEVSHD
jgi:RNA polymerase sigma-70 factor (ECF subfamily)